MLDKGEYYVDLIFQIKVKAASQQEADEYASEVLCNTDKDVVIMRLDGKYSVMTKKLESAVEKE